LLDDIGPRPSKYQKKQAKLQIEEARDSFRSPEKRIEQLLARAGECIDEEELEHAGGLTDEAYSLFERDTGRSGKRFWAARFAATYNRLSQEFKKKQSELDHARKPSDDVSQLRMAKEFLDKSCRIIIFHSDAIGIGNTALHAIPACYDLAKAYIIKCYKISGRNDPAMASVEKGYLEEAEKLAGKAYKIFTHPSYAESLKCQAEFIINLYKNLMAFYGGKGDFHNSRVWGRRAHTVYAGNRSAKNVDDSIGGVITEYVSLIDEDKEIDWLRPNLDKFKAAAADDPSDVMALTVSAVLSFKLKQYPEALDFAQKAVRFEGLSVSVRAKLANIIKEATEYISLPVAGSAANPVTAQIMKGIETQVKAMAA
jgi:tetratricopeptide (TPR) repeat protein